MTESGDEKGERIDSLPAHLEEFATNTAIIRLHYAVSAAEKIFIQQERIFASAVFRSGASTSHLRIILLSRCHSFGRRNGSY